MGLRAACKSGWLDIDRYKNKKRSWMAQSHLKMTSRITGEFATKDQTEESSRH